MKIGIFGGSFDPIHFGHLMMAERIRDHFQLDQILFMPVRVNPFKTRFPPASSEHRIEMIQLSIQNNPFFALSMLEISGPEISYTIDTLRTLKRNFPPHTQFYFLGGTDLLPDFAHWKESQELIQEASWVIFSRGNTDARELKAQYPFILPYHEFSSSLSSSLIRRLSREGKSIRYLVPHEVCHYIQKNGIYQNSETDDNLP